MAQYTAHTKIIEPNKKDFSQSHNILYEEKVKVFERIGHIRLTFLFVAYLGFILGVYF